VCIGGLALDLEPNISIKVGLWGADDLGMRTRAALVGRAGVVVGLLGGAVVSGCGTAPPPKVSALGAPAPSTTSDASPATSTTVVLPVCTAAQNPFGVPAGTTCQAYEITFVLSQVGTSCSDLANLLGYDNGTTVKVSGSSGQQVAVGSLGAPMDKEEPLVGGGTAPTCVFGSSFDIPAGQTAYTFVVGGASTSVSYTIDQILNASPGSNGFSTTPGSNGFLMVGLVGGTERNNISTATGMSLFTAGVNEANGT
jgi:hypothetical protein